MSERLRFIESLELISKKYLIPEGSVLNLFKVLITPIELKLKMI